MTVVGKSRVGFKARPANGRRCSVKDEEERCALCGCRLHRTGVYATPSVEGRSHATEHHFVAERFFGRSKTRKGEPRMPIFERCPWPFEGKRIVCCYECHEELLHNPVFTPEDMKRFRRLVVERGVDEDEKPQDRDKVAGRIRLLHEVIDAGLRALTGEAQPTGDE